MKAEMVFKNIFLLILISVLTSGCALWPYKRDFDCPIKEGLKCKSLYEVSVMADQGMFAPNVNKSLLEKKSNKQKTVKCQCYGRCKAQGVCNVG